MERGTIRLVRAGRRLTAAALLALAGCGGGNVESEAPQAAASTDVEGQALPSALSIQTTHRALDVAIDGGGAFVLRDPRSGIQVLSRLGHFDIDALGRLVNGEGWLVEGLAASQTPSTLSELAPLRPVSAVLPPVATRNVVVEANLDWRASVFAAGSPGSLELDIHDAGTYNNATALDVFDAVGQAVSLIVYFRQVGPSVWNVHAYANDVALSPDVDGVPQPIVQLSFRPDGAAPINPDGADVALPPVVVDVPVTLSSHGSTTAAIAGVRMDLSRLSSFAGPFGVTYVHQDGARAATLLSASVRATGELVLLYDDARIDDSRRLILARTSVADRLQKYGESGWICGRGCLSPVVAQPGQMLTGTLVPGALNVGS